jgi:hypothetical protein
VELQPRKDHAAAKPCTAKGVSNDDPSGRSGMNSGCPPTDSQLGSGGWAEGERRADKWIHESVIVEAIVEFTYVWGTSVQSVQCVKKGETERPGRWGNQEFQRLLTRQKEIRRWTDR